MTADAAADLGGPSGAEDTLVVDGGTTLRIAARDLVVTGEDPGRGGGGGGEDEALTGAGPVVKRRRTCGLFATGSTGEASLLSLVPASIPSPPPRLLPSCARAPLRTPSLTGHIPTDTR